MKKKVVPIKIITLKEFEILKIKNPEKVIGGEKVEKTEFEPPTI